MPEIIRPTLMVDKEKCHQNIEKMLHKTREHGLKFRPHFKTHQSAQIGEWYRKYDINSITVSSVKMAEYFASHGWNDITIAFPLNILEIENINRLAANIHLNLLIENKDAAIFLAKNCKYKTGVYLKIDTGYHRTGILASKTGYIDHCLEILSDNKKITFKGFLSHTGHTYHAKSTNEIFSRHFDALLKMNSLKTKYQKKYPKVEISMGDTPSSSICSNFKGVDELRPGNFIFYDLMQYSLGVCQIDDIAVRMACPVIAKHLSRNEIVIYGGAIHFSKDSVLNTDGKRMYGRIVLTIDGEKKLLDTKNYLAQLSQEHGILKISPNLFKHFNIGDLIEVLPIHSCLTANLAKSYLTTEGELIKTINFSV